MFWKSGETDKVPWTSRYLHLLTKVRFRKLPSNKVFLFTCLSCVIIAFFYFTPEYAFYSRSTVRGGDDLPRTNNLFVHIHIAKTAGSTANRLWARRYHGVCGHKGFSFTQPLTSGRDNRTDPRFPGFGRDKVHPARMVDWGFHNCALISHEINSDALSRILNAKHFSFVRKVGILPCREPVDHFLSQCNYLRLNASSVLQKTCDQAASECRVFWSRFNVNTLKMFDYVLFYKYSELELVTLFLDKYLPLRAIELDPGEKYATNRERESQNEHFSDICTQDKLRSTLTSAWLYYSTCEELGVAPMKILRRDNMKIPLQ